VADPAPADAEQVLDGPEGAVRLFWHHRAVLRVSRADERVRHRDAQTGGDRNTEPADSVGSDHPDRVGPSGQQAAGGRVGDEAQLLGRLLDAQPSLGTQQAAPVERFRGRPDGDAGQRGHLADRHRPPSLHTVSVMFPSCFLIVFRHRPDHLIVPACGIASPVTGT
jgi:hypothetical protein